MMRYEGEVLRIIYLQLIAVNILDDKNFGARTFICAQRKAVEVAVVQQCIVFAYTVFTGLQFWLFHGLCIWHQLQLLYLELVRRHKSGAAVHLAVTCPRKPSESFFIKAVDVHIRPARKEVVLHELDHCLALAFAGRVVWHTEDRFKAYGFHILGKLISHDIVAVVLIHKHPAVMVIYHLLGNSAKVPERQMMGIDR